MRIVLSPFPFDDERTYDESSRNAAVVSETAGRTGIHLEDTKRVDGQWRVAGESGMRTVVTRKGETMRAAREQAYGRIDEVLMPNMYHRDDTGERWVDGDGERLQAWGGASDPDARPGRRLPLASATGPTPGGPLHDFLTVRPHYSGYAEVLDGRRWRR